MTKAITIIALTCFLVVGAAAASILGRDSVPAARAEMTSPIVESPVANRESKQDKLAVAALALASFEPPQTSSLSEPLRQAYAASSAADIEAAEARHIGGDAAGDAREAEACHASRRRRNPMRCSATCRSPASRSG